MKTRIEIRPNFKKIGGKFEIVNYSFEIGDKRYSHICETEDIAYLVAMGIKYDGIDSKFAKMPCRMLNIESAWAE